MSNIEMSSVQTLGLTRDEVLTDEKIMKKYPLVFGDVQSSQKRDPISLGFEVPNAWLPELDVLFSKINDEVQRANLQDFKVLQVKSKWKALRIYTSGANEEIEALIREAEYKL